MKIKDMLGISFGNFKRRKLRSFLTVSGVVIGTASIVVMVSLGLALNVTFSKEMENMGNMNEIQVYPAYDSSTGKEKALTDEQVEELRALENVVCVSPSIDVSGKAFTNKYEAYLNFTGISLEYLEAKGCKIERGEALSRENIAGGKNLTCVMGGSVPFQFQKKQRGNGMFFDDGVPDDVEVPPNGWAYGGKVYDEQGNVVATYLPECDPLDQKNRIKFTFDYSYGEPNTTGEATKKAPLYNLHTVGVMSSDGSDSYQCYVDIETAKKLKKDMAKWSGDKSRNNSYQQIFVLSNNIENTIALSEQIKKLGYNCYANAEWINQSKKMQQIVQLVLAGIGSVSLIVAAIGITNTMIMSIYERTKEIGVMKVIGCYLKDIRTMFLFEAGFIGFFGGVVGILLSYGASLILNKVGAMMSGNGEMLLSVIPFWLALAAIAFSTMVGIVSGYFPARRAMKLSALDAIKT